MISGGSENVLVIWQMDTSKKDFLPHLSGSIENIVVSASGASYAVHLDDNTALVLSTSEMKPTAYVTGMQSSVSSLSPPKDLLVQRVWTTPDHVRQPIPAAIQPGDASKLHICVGNGRQATLSGQISAPLLQSIDLETFTSSMTQPLARTQPTDVNITNKGVPIDEPLVTHIAFSSDGRWLASIDEWKPSEKDVENVSSEMREQFVRERYEVYLKFWEMDSESGSAALVSRINAPHATTQPETILDLATNPVASCFATIGSDGLVRLWQPKVRQQDGIVIKGAKGQDATSWSCTQVIAISDGLSKEAAVDVVHSTRPTKRQGSITFSEDGSMIVVAFGAVDTGMLYIIDATSGEVIKTIESLWSGQLHSVKTLSPFIVILSDELRVYDVVGDELRYGIDLPHRPEFNDLLQLAVDYKSGHFAIALPNGLRSSIGVFNPEEADPLLVHTLPHHVVSLISSPDTSGFMIVDDAAQVWSVSEGSNPKSLAALQPLEDMRLDKVETESANGLNGISQLLDDDTNMASEGEDDDGEADLGKDGDIDMDDDDDDMHASVVAPQHLAEIFDAAPAFAAPSIEDMFYKVTGLLGGKPLAVTMEQ
jgi:NET1-associated nuclear protein 1 (U3 small nucleolar RNA-associated protein 17)